jgi:epsin
LADFNYFEGSLDRGSGIREKAKMLMELVGENGRVREEREKARRLREKFVGIGVTGGVRGIGGGLEAGRAGGFGRDSDLYRMGGREERYTDRVDGEGGREGGRKGGWERDRYYDEFKPRNGGRDGGRKEADPTVSPEEDHGGGRRGGVSEEAGEGRRRGSKEGGRLEIRLTEQKKPVSPTVDLLGGDFFGGGGGGRGGGEIFRGLQSTGKGVVRGAAPPPPRAG